MKKFLWKICPFILFILVLEIAIPMAVDPYNVFHWRQIRDNGVEPNSNYIKMEYILHNPDKFDSMWTAFRRENGTTCPIRRDSRRNTWRICKR